MALGGLGYAASSPEAAPRRVPTMTVDLNTADAAELQLLPGVGPARADAIVRDRAARGPYRTLDELDRVPRIGPRTIAGLSPDARLGG